MQELKKVIKKKFDQPCFIGEKVSDPGGIVLAIKTMSTAFDFDTWSAKPLGYCSLSYLPPVLKVFNPSPDFYRFDPGFDPGFEFCSGPGKMLVSTYLHRGF